MFSAKTPSWKTCLKEIAHNGNLSEWEGDYTKFKFLNKLRSFIFFSESINHTAD